MATPRANSYAVASGAGVFAGRVNPVPAWRAGLAPWQWKEIAGSSMSGVNATVPPAGAAVGSARINAWTALAVNRATSEVASLANGGHGDYAGNEVVILGLAADSPTWVIDRQPTPAASVQDVSGGLTHYLDGRPPSSHGYYGRWHVPGLGWAVTSAQGTWVNGNTADMLYVYNAGDWAGGGTYPNTAYSGPGMVGSHGYGGQAQDQATGVVYLPAAGGGAGFKRLNADGTFTTLANVPGVGNDAWYYRPLAYDHTRGKLFVLGDQYLTTSQGRVWTNDGGAGSWAIITFTGLSTQFDASSSYGAEYCPDVDKIVVALGSAGSIVTVDPVTYAVTAQATTSGGSIPAAVLGVYGRFKYVPALKGFMYYPAYSGNVWFLATGTL